MQDPDALLLEIERHLSLHVQRFLDSHAGSVRVRSVRPTGEVELEFKGACTSCPALPATFYTAVAPVVRQVPGVTAVTSGSVNISEAAVQRLEKLRSNSRTVVAKT
ncbi:MAG: NifU family protein [Thermomicrobiales bacterium]